MKEKIETIIKNAKEESLLIKTEADYLNIKSKYLGKKSELVSLMSTIKDMNKEDKQIYGPLFNKTKTELENLFKDALEKNTAQSLKTFDPTLPVDKESGTIHPVTIVAKEVTDILKNMGFIVLTGPEMDSEYYNFEALNVPKTHPARDMQDSFYITNEYLLRTQTSAVQARTMLANTEKTPIRMICAGKTYRREDDATHSHQFGQVEGLVIDKKERHVSLADLKGTLEIFVKKLIGKNCELRFRPSYFPFTEPSYEVDVSCFKCGGKGCSLCKQTGWIEVLGAGIVHPNVLKMNGYDPEEYGGFAFGTGLERLAMFKYGIPDMRYLYANDIRFLSQFDRKDEE